MYRHHAPGENTVAGEPEAQSRSLGKNLPPGLAHLDHAAVAPAARMDAGDVVFLGPYRHHFDEIGVFEGEIKSLLRILGSGVIFGDHVAG